MSKISTPQYIIGAGLTGLIAAHAWPTATVVEKATEPPITHRAVLRFRSDAVARLTGVEFRPVRVRKGIYSRGNFCESNIRLANQYSSKVLGGRVESDRSIWNLDAVDRFIAPDTFHEQLLEQVMGTNRLTLDFDATQLALVGMTPVVSTIPLNIMCNAVVNDYHCGEEFFRAPIMVQRFRVPGADVFQTIYFPDPALGVYRASMTGDTLIIESVCDVGIDHMFDLGEVIAAFGLSGSMEKLEEVEQKYGKIAPINEQVRRELLFRLTQDYKVYSLGRFATWKNILLDDVVKDIDVIKLLMKAGSTYDHRLKA